MEKQIKNILFKKQKFVIAFYSLKHCLCGFFLEKIENFRQNLNSYFFEMSKFLDLKLKSQTSDANFLSSLTPHAQSSDAK